MPRSEPGVWLPAVRALSGADVFTERLATALRKRGIRTEITWLPHWAEYAPWLVPVPKPPPWATVVHVNSWLHPRLIPIELPVVATIHGCVHDPAFEPYKSRLQKLYHRRWIRRIEQDTLSRADVVTAVSRYTADRAAETFHRGNIRWIYNWIDAEVFRPTARREPHMPFRLLFVGNLNRRKGADLLPAIMRRLGDRFTLRFTGTAVELGASTALPSNMIPLGRVQGSRKLVAVYHQSDALLFPTRLEGFSLSALEAQACGLPIISTDRSSMPELVVDGATGLLCQADDVESFADAATRLLEQPAMWRRMIEAASRRAQLFAEQAAVTAFTEIYRSLATG